MQISEIGHELFPLPPFIWNIPDMFEVIEKYSSKE